MQETLVLRSFYGSGGSQSTIPMLFFLLTMASSEAAPWVIVNINKKLTLNGAWCIPGCPKPLTCAITLLFLMTAILHMGTLRPREGV